MTMTTHQRGIEDALSLVPLGMLRAGQSGRIGAVTGVGGLAHRLHEMGMRSGAFVQMIRSGSPCIIRIDGHKLCLRADELTNVLVRMGAAC